MIPFRASLFGSSAVAVPAIDTLIAVQDFATGGDGPKTLNVTTTALGGVTPKAVLVFQTNQFPANDPNGTVGAAFSFGARSASAQRIVRLYSENGAASSDVLRITNGSSITGIYSNTAGGNTVLGSGSLIANGVALDLTVNSGSRRGLVVAFAGNDVCAAVGQIALGTGTNAITVNVGFQPDVVLFFGANVDDSPASAVFAATFGIVVNDGSVTQRCVAMAESDAVASGGNPMQAIITGYVSQQINPSGGAQNYRISAGNFTSTGFGVTPSASTSSDGLGYVALKFGGKQFALRDFTTPTTTGDHAITGVGFQPQFALMFLTNLEAVDPTFPLTTSDLMGGLTISAIGDEQWSGNIRIDSGADPTSTASNMQNKAIQAASATSTAAVVATLVSFDSDGMTLNYTAVQATGKKGFILFVE